MGLTPNEMEEAIIKNLPSKTGKTIDEWLEVVRALKVNDKKEILRLLKTEYGLGHFQAQVILKKMY